MDLWLSDEQRWTYAWRLAQQLAGGCPAREVILRDDGQTTTLVHDVPHDWLGLQPYKEAKRCARVQDLLPQDERSAIYSLTRAALLDAAGRLVMVLPDVVRWQEETGDVLVGYVEQEGDDVRRAIDGGAEAEPRAAVSAHAGVGAG